jgi:anti-anti-sigma regulatory factor/anti-sigma regulatory factor (Ser/Thr protein kinase)
MIKEPVPERLTASIEHDFHLGLGHVILRGEWDATSAPTARSAILKCAAEHPQAVIVDLDRVNLVDRRFLMVLVAVARRLSDDQITTLLVADPVTLIGQAVRRQPHAMIPVHATRDDAIAATADAVPSLTRLHLHLPPLTTSPAIARSLVEYACDSWRLDDLADRARLIMSEIVSNAVVHAMTDLDVTVVLRRDYLILQVRDRSLDTPRSPDVDADSPYAEHGRGLRLVDMLATSWGSSTGEHGKTVWVTLRHRPLTRP